MPQQRQERGRGDDQHRAVYSGESIGDLDNAIKGRAQIILLAALINSERLDEVGLDAFLADASKLANQWLA